MLEDPFGEQEEPQPERKTFSPYWVLAAIIVGIGGALFSGKLWAEPRFVADGDNGALITLHDEPCAIQDKITNLPFRATWTENGKSFEGCWAPVKELQLVQAYFEDKTAFPIPFQMLKRAQGA